MTAASARSVLVGGTAGSAAILVAGRGLGLVTTLALAVLLGAEGYGAYAWALAWLAILRVPAALGRDRLLVREVAAYAAGERWGLMRGLLSDSARAVLVASAAFTAAAAALVLALRAPLSSPLLAALHVGLVMLPLLALTHVAQGALQGLQRVVAAQAPDALLRPLLFLALLGAGALAFGDDWTPEAALLLQAGAALAALVATAWLLRAHLPAPARTAEPRDDSARWHRSGLLLAANSLLYMLHQRLDLVLVGVLLGASDAGVYGVVVAAASLAGMVFAAVAIPLGPLVARLHAERDRARLARVVTVSARAIFAGTLVVAAALALGGTAGLGLLGEEFEDGAAALALLCAAAVVNAACGANTLVLVMTGLDARATATTALGAAATAALCLALIPPWGIEGAAAAMVAATLARNALACWYAWTRRGVDTTIVGRDRVGAGPA